MGFRRVPDDVQAPPPEGPEGGSAQARQRQPALEETEFPAIDVYETAGELIVEAELPGADPEQIAVSAGEGLIVIEGVKQDEAGEAGRLTFLCMERSFGPFRRAVVAGRAVDVTRATASYREGILQVRVPKVDEKRGRRRVIPVETAPGEKGGIET